MTIARANAAGGVGGANATTRAQAADATSGHHCPLLCHPKRVAIVASASAASALLANRAGADAGIAAILAAVLVVLAAIDLDSRIIPNRIVLPAVAVMLIAHAAVDPASVLMFALASMVSGAVFVLPSLGRRPWMGMGDVKLIMLLGAGLGAGVVGAVLVAFLSLFPLAVLTLIRGGLTARRTALPFGPSLAFGGLFILLAPHLFGA
jgi:leader peptidase (prepilin peptidase) / N-methyltransferase